jgi:pimeloyl-ACP methyl ester carboxylesterase
MVSRMDVRTALGWGILPVLCALLLPAVLCGCPYVEALPGLYPLGRPPADGQFTTITVDGKDMDLFYIKKGTGTPHIVVLNGLDENVRLWKKTLPGLAELGTVVIYDRGGVGWSDPGLDPRTATVINTEMREFLQSIAFEPPYILVAHSLGGLYARLYAHVYPDEVSGIVLVDTTHEDYWWRTGLLLSAKTVKALDRSQNLSEAIITTGQLGALGEFQNTDFNSSLVRTNRALPDVPLIMLGESIAQFSLVTSDEDEAQRVTMLMREFYQDQADLTPGGKWITVENSSHFMMQDQPAVLVDATRQVIEGW